MRYEQHMGVPQAGSPPAQDDLQPEATYPVPAYMYRGATQPEPPLREDELGRYLPAGEVTQQIFIFHEPGKMQFIPHHIPAPFHQSKVWEGLVVMIIYMMIVAPAFFFLIAFLLATLPVH